MKKLKDFQNELNKCSKCGLCQDVCPIFELSSNECAVSKGKFIMLHGVTKGDLKLSKNINKYIDMCLKCGKCNNSCSAGIDVCQILNTAKYEYMNGCFISKIVKFLHGSFIFGNFIRFGKLISKPFRPKKNVSKNPTMKVLYFKGCVNQVCPKTDNYLHKIFKNRDIEIIDPDFDCCGLPFLSEGNMERFEQAAKYNLKLLSTDCDYIVADCASCESTVKDYSKYFNTEPVEIYPWGNLIALQKIHFKFNKNIKVTFHKPCHLSNDAFFRQILGNCENVEYTEMKDYDSCCGMAGTFAIKNSNLAKKLMTKKGKNISETNTDYVITTCPACIVGLKAGLFLAGNRKTKVVSLLEFLAKADEIN